MKIRKNDIVKVITGRERGKTGRVISIDQKKSTILVERVNFVKRHQKPNQQFKQGGIIEKEAPLQISNVMFYDEKAGKSSRIGYQVTDGKKVRIAKRTGAVIADAAK